MTTHELANILLQQEDVPVEFHFYHDEANCYWSTPINVAELYEGIMYLAETEFVSPEEEERRWEEECRIAEEERRRKKEAEAKLPTLKNVFKLVSEEASDAFILYIDDWDDRDRILNNTHEDPAWLGRVLLSHYATNARLSKEYMLEILHACIQFGIMIPESIITTVENHDISQNQRDMFKFETDRRWREACRNKNK
jgi:hypothetical protein